MRLILIFLLLGMTVTGVAQEFSEREEIAVFQLSYYGQPEIKPPPGLKVEIRGRRGSLTVELRGTGDPAYDDLFIRAFGAVDERIRSVFINLGRFDVIGMDQRLTQDSVTDFIDVLTEFKRSQTELPEAVLLGQQAFTEADFQELVGGFVVVIPSVSWYSLTPTEDDRFRAEIETSFTFINVEDLTTFGQFFVTTSGADEQPALAIRDAVNGISSQLEFRIRSMPEFQIKTGILEVSGREVIMEFGRNMGLRPGDEYSIISTRVLSTGHIAKTETGLVIVTEVQDGFSVGRVLYARPSAMVGDQLQEVPRRGVELSGYVNSIANGLTGLTYTAGFRGVASRGFYQLRPLAAVEIPFRPVLAQQLLPLNLMAGGEYNLIAGRLRIAPALTVGLGGAVPLSTAEDLETFYLSHVGAQLRVTTSVLVSRDLRVFVDAGFAFWGSVYDNSVARLIEPLSSYGGLIIGAGVTFK